MVKRSKIRSCLNSYGKSARCASTDSIARGRAVKRDRTWSRWLPVVLLGLSSANCDNRQAFHRPEPGLERMLQQRRGDRYAASSFFADGRVMRTPPPFSVAREQAAVGNREIETGR